MIIGRGAQVGAKQVRRTAVLVFTWAILGIGALASAASVEIAIEDNTRFHVFRPGEPFSFDIMVTVTSGAVPDGLGYQWRDFRGNPLGPVNTLADGVQETVKSPSDTPAIGYYGLVFLPDDPGVEFNNTSGSRREIGFVVLPPKAPSERKLIPTSPFGIVHADLDDPYLSTWVKTLTWNTTGSAAWNSEMQRRRDRGFQELPLISGKGWGSDDTAPISNDFIVSLTEKARSYFAADPDTEFWELGREENLSSRFDEPAYFSNLKAKVAALRDVAIASNVNLVFLYQIGGRSLRDAEAFFASEAADEFDIFAPHPYVWPDFPTPEEWLEKFIDDRRAAMQKHGIDFPIWITEVGAPQNDAQVQQMLSGDKPVRGQSRAENAAYLVKTHIISLARGIEKIFWYNYIDRDPSTTDVEDHFGLIDFWGFPKPSYAAYVTLVANLEGKAFRGRRDLSGGIRVYEFGDADQLCFVAWTYPALMRKVPLSSIHPGLDEDNILAVTNAVGTPRPVSGAVLIEESPVFVLAPRDIEGAPASSHSMAAAGSAGEIRINGAETAENLPAAPSATNAAPGADADEATPYKKAEATTVIGDESVTDDPGSDSGSGAISVVFLLPLIVVMMLKSRRRFARILVGQHYPTLRRNSPGNFSRGSYRVLEPHRTFQRPIYSDSIYSVSSRDFWLRFTQRKIFSSSRSP